MVIRVLASICAMLFISLDAEAATKCVNGTTGDDSNTYIQNNGTRTCWQTIGRAAWGSSNRSSPNPGEAAAAGDTVLIAPGTYDFSGTVGNRLTPIYNPANEGTPGHAITFQAVGRVVLTAADASSPVIGAYDRDYIKWSGPFTMSACGENPINSIDDCPPGTVASTPDTGPVVCWLSAGCWFEGLVISGHAPINYADNWSAIRFQNSTGGMARNNDIRDFTRAPVFNHNQTAFTLYGTSDTTIEHNFCSNTGAMVYFKDTGSANAQFGNIVRYNRCANVHELVAWSHASRGSTEGRNFTYQNIGENVETGFALLGTINDDIFNNVISTISQSAVQISTADNLMGVRVFNNIFVTSVAFMVSSTNGPMPADSRADLEHNVYHLFRMFYGGTDGNRSFASYQERFADQDQDSPVSLNGDPLFVSPGAGDYRLCVGPGVPAVECSDASPALTLGVDIGDLDADGLTNDPVPAGAYITGTECIGLESTCPSPPSLIEKNRPRPRGNQDW